MKLIFFINSIILNWTPQEQSQIQSKRQLDKKRQCKSKRKQTERHMDFGDFCWKSAYISIVRTPESANSFLLCSFFVAQSSRMRRFFTRQLNNLSGSASNGSQQFVGNSPRNVFAEEEANGEQFYETPFEFWNPEFASDPVEWERVFGVF